MHTAHDITPFRLFHLIFYISLVPLLFLFRSLCGFSLVKKIQHEVFFIACFFGTLTLIYLGVGASEIIKFMAS